MLMIRKAIAPTSPRSRLPSLGFNSCSPAVLMAVVLNRRHGPVSCDLPYAIFLPA
jgi:hypothetical protein